MAKQIITKILDDIDGGHADESVTFALDGIGYEIDLSTKNSNKLREFLSTYIDSATRTGRVGTGATTPMRRSMAAHMVPHAQNRAQNTAIREWAQSNGYQVAERGRIPQLIVDAYHDNRPNLDRAQATIENVEAAEEVEESEPVMDTKPTMRRRSMKKVAAPLFKPERSRI